MAGIVFAYVVALAAIVALFKLIVLVPEQHAYVVELLGKYRKTLGSGLHVLLPFVEKVAYRHQLKEDVIDVEPQVCITSDNVQVTVDGILYYKIFDPALASYGIDDYRFATVQLAKTTMRSEIGKIELDRSFAEREAINDNIVRAVDEATDPWGIKVTRYEVRSITPSEVITEAMERQMRAEREKRAEILASEGVKESRINVSKGERQEAINISMGERTRTINQAEGKAKAIGIVSDATAEGLRLVAEALSSAGGKSAMALRLAEQYVDRLGQILGSASAQVLPEKLAEMRGLAEVLGLEGARLPLEPAPERSPDRGPDRGSPVGEKVRIGRPAREGGQS
ncbi:MAG TPA: SPFH domain-containing protein [Spirochaetales bacterium]|nr:SPFH domain-containing protein [Spirochaetales bacterium]